MKEFTVAIPKEIDEILRGHLVREDMQEDLLFALWNISAGLERTTALIKKVVMPIAGDRQVHGNVSFNAQYFKRVCNEAIKEKCGIAFLHSHPSLGWQGMSEDDVNAELKLSTTTETLTDLPLVGLTAGHDCVWSGRIWNHSEQSLGYEMLWAKNVRVVGDEFDIHYASFLNTRVSYRENLKRTITVWGQNNQEKVARLRIGIVGLGSVGSLVAESLARMGMQNITLIDFDRVETHNLDRLLGATQDDIGKLKADVCARHIHQSSTAERCDVRSFPVSIASKEGYKACLDCDVIFSCVDKPRARYILNHLAFNHLIPIIDGGIQVRFNEEGLFVGSEWQVQSVMPGKCCLECLNAYSKYQVYLEKDGLLENASYLKGLGALDPLKNNENIFPFSMNLASLEIFQFIALTTKIGGISDFGVQRFRYTNGIISVYHNRKCDEGCTFPDTVADGDKYLQVYDF